MALEKPGKLREFFYPTLWPPCKKSPFPLSVAAKGLDLYQVLAPNAFSYLEEFIPVIRKTVQSQVHSRAMTQFRWHDGTLKNIHVDMSLLFEYQKQLGAVVKLYEKRIDWLSCGSRKFFGSVTENKYVTVFFVFFLHFGRCSFVTYLVLYYITLCYLASRRVTLYCYLRRRLASGEGIVSLGVRLSRSHAVCVFVCVHRIILDGEGNALYPVLSSYYYYYYYYYHHRHHFSARQPTQPCAHCGTVK